MTKRKATKRGTEVPESLREVMRLIEMSADIVDSVPPALTRSFCDVRELDAVLANPLSVIEKKLQALLSTVESPSDTSVQPRHRLRLLRELADDVNGYRLGCNDKIRLANGVVETLGVNVQYMSTLFSLMTHFMPESTLSRLPPENTPWGFPITETIPKRKSEIPPNVSLANPVRLKGALSLVHTQWLQLQQALAAPAPHTQPGFASEFYDPKNPAHAVRGLSDPSTGNFAAAGTTKRGRGAGVPSGASATADAASTSAADDPPPAKRGPGGRPPNKALKKPIVGPNGTVSTSVSKARTPEAKRRRKDDADDEYAKHMPADAASDGPKYCYCGRPSFGEMIGCDGDDCIREWFHLGCVGLQAIPKGKWYCKDCRVALSERAKRVSTQ